MSTNLTVPIDIDRIEVGVIELMTHRLLEEMSEEDYEPDTGYSKDDDVPGLAPATKAKIRVWRETFRNKVAAKVKERVDVAITQHLDAAVAEALQRPLQATNNVGEPQGEPISILAYARSVAEGWLDAKPDRYQAETNRQRMVKEAVERFLGGWQESNGHRKEPGIRPLIDAEVKRVRDACLSSLGTTVEAAMRRILGMRETP